MYKLRSHLTIVNNLLHHGHYGWHDSTCSQKIESTDDNMHGPCPTYADWYPVLEIKCVELRNWPPLIGHRPVIVKRALIGSNAG